MSEEYEHIFLSADFKIRNLRSRNKEIIEKIHRLEAKYTSNMNQIRYIEKTEYRDLN